MAEPLQLNSVIGFGGSVENGLLVHPDGRTLIYTLGSTVVLRDKADPRSQEFLQGHSDKVHSKVACQVWPDRPYQTIHHSSMHEDQL
jgi:hypothetical protein